MPDHKAALSMQAEERWPLGRCLSPTGGLTTPYTLRTCRDCRRLNQALSFAASRSARDLCICYGIASGNLVVALPTWTPSVTAPPQFIFGTPIGNAVMFFYAS